MVAASRDTCDVQAGSARLFSKPLIRAAYVVRALSWHKCCAREYSIAAHVMRALLAESRVMRTLVAATPRRRPRDAAKLLTVL